MDGATHAQVGELLSRYKGLKLESAVSVDGLAGLIEERQKVIDQLSQIDESLAVLRQTIADDPELQELLAQIMEADRDLMEQARVAHDQLRAALAKTNKGRQATSGYRLHIPRSPAIIDKKV